MFEKARDYYQPEYLAEVQGRGRREKQMKRQQRPLQERKAETK